MRLKIEKCKKCGSIKPIVNRKHLMCNECNFERRNGKTREEVYFERSKLRAEGEPKKKIVDRKQIGSGNDISKLKKKFSINKISSKGKYRCSNGDLISQVDLNRRMAEVKDRLQYEREPICQATGRNDFPLSWSHTISVARCKEIGKTELCYSPDNLELEGYHERSSNNVAGHNIWEDSDWEEKSKLLNFGRKLEFIRIHDPEAYNKIPYEYKDLYFGV